MRHSVDEIEQIRKLRRQGYSINKITTLLFLPKTTVWYQIQDIKLKKDQKRALRSLQGGSNKRKLDFIDKAKIEASNLLKSIYREYFVIFAMLYWAEGHKKSGCEFTNSDGVMIKIYLAILRKIVNVKEEKLSVTVRVFSGMDYRDCLKYWSEITGVSQEKCKLRINDGGQRGRTPFGICRITIKKGHYTLKLIHALISQISKEILNNLPS